MAINKGKNRRDEESGVGNGWAHPFLSYFLMGEFTPPPSYPPPFLPLFVVVVVSNWSEWKSINIGCASLSSRSKDPSQKCRLDGCQPRGLVVAASRPNPTDQYRQPPPASTMTNYAKRRLLMELNKFRIQLYCKPSFATSPRPWILTSFL